MGFDSVAAGAVVCGYENPTYGVRDCVVSLDFVGSISRPSRINSKDSFLCLAVGLCPDAGGGNLS